VGFAKDHDFWTNVLLKRFGLLKEREPELERGLETIEQELAEIRDLLQE
jgi:hypothetical protein